MNDQKGVKQIAKDFADQYRKGLGHSPEEALALIRELKTNFSERAHQ